MINWRTDFLGGSGTLKISKSGVGRGVTEPLSAKKATVGVITCGILTVGDIVFLGET